MTDPILGPRASKNEPPAGWGVLLALLEDWGTVLRLVLLLSIPIAAAVVIVIYLGPIGATAVLTSGVGGGYGIKRFLTRRRRRRSRGKA